MKISLSEDNELLRKSLSFFLQANGFEVDQFSNGKEALDAISEKEYDIILTDINMPGASGLEIANHVRTELLRDTPIIIFTSINVEQTELDAFEIGANEFIPKPVSPQVLLVRIKKLLGANARAVTSV
ncbi:response regulator transcription factor [Flavobacterium granuli]|uniref:DNA-binding response OmpR family regulator n=1 Tax=Flavobacterium granuli TaxID=280093 RepID=A0ABU1S4K2_9FLAO|nr:response regulator transcription factor [Flavobacterium granuli]MDR6845948.1 DNA-binding response OmpR family regulator [Flavobacterium granuli]